MEGAKSIEQMPSAAAQPVLSGTAMAWGAIGGLAGLFFYKTTELFVQGFLGGGFQFTAAEKITTIVLILVIVGLMHFVSAGSSRELAALERSNDERIKALRADIEKLRASSDRQEVTRDQA